MDKGKIYQEKPSTDDNVSHNLDQFTVMQCEPQHDDILVQIHPRHHNMAVLERIGARVVFVDDVRGLREREGGHDAPDVWATLQQQHPCHSTPQT